MSRRPSDQIARSRDAEGRQVIWDAIRAQEERSFAVADIHADTWISRRTIRSYLSNLTAGGVLERMDTDDGLRWRMQRDEGFYAPRLNRLGEPVTQGMGVEQMWRSMRLLKEFTSRDVALYATTETIKVSDESAKSYCSMLLACGYLTCILQANPHRQARYRLTRNSGPLAPQVQRVKQVFDPNSKAVYRKGEA